MDKKEHQYLRKGVPTYQLDVFVRLKNDEVEHTLFEDGKETKTEVIKI